MSTYRDPRRKPEWLRVKAFSGETYSRVTALLRDLGLQTVCQEANCPNRGECFNRGTAVFLIMGPRCTRNCSFCDVTSGPPSPLDPSEPVRVAEASSRLQLKHVVVTSVTRDDLADGGAGHFAATIRELRRGLPRATIEVLTPDLRGSDSSLRTVLAERPDVFNHNVETVPRLYASVRPGADYRRSLDLLRRARDIGTSVTKSGVMVGLGETTGELKDLFADLAGARISILTIGQYLAPSREHHPVVRYLHPDEFTELEKVARAIGIGTVVSGPLVRSSYMADLIADRL
ncbi:MAG TPA: lipoyl synthase [Candidatus Acidoferrum sp.]|nr:lipoyl synthase [Candidatus Acidoferrum sp.]